MKSFYRMFLLVSTLTIFLLSTALSFAEDCGVECTGSTWELQYKGSVISLGDMTEIECETLKTELGPQTEAFTDLQCVEVGIKREDIEYTAPSANIMPQTIVLIVCKVEFIGLPNENARMTGWRDTEWDMTNGQMHCRRIQVDVYDKDVDQGATPQPFTPIACMRTAMKLGPQFDADAGDKPWRFWRSACPVPIKNYGPDGVMGTPDDETVGWQLPPCPSSNGTVVCDQDTVI
jgi:hypothetical protein